MPNGFQVRQDLIGYTETQSGERPNSLHCLKYILYLKYIFMCTYIGFFQAETSKQTNKQ